MGVCLCEKVAFLDFEERERETRFYFNRDVYYHLLHTHTRIITNIFHSF